MVTRKASVPIARHRDNDPHSTYLANSIVTLISDEEVVGPIHGHPSWEIQMGPGSRATIAGVAFRSISRYGGDRPGRIDLANALIGSVGDVEVADLIHSYSEWSAKTGARGCAMVTGK